MTPWFGSARGKVVGVHTAKLHQRGLSLVELMISITLGMVAVAGAISIYLANRSSYKTVEGVARLQENARFAVEYLGRDLREAGGMACGGNLVQENVLDPTSFAQWWGDWSTGLNGYQAGQSMPARGIGTGSYDRRAGTDAIVVWSASTATPSPISSYNARVFTVDSGFAVTQGDVFTACDNTRISTFTVNQTATGTVTATETLTTAINPGGFVNQLNASAWYIGVGANASSPSSLYRVSRDSPTQEILENVSDMKVSYLLGDGSGAPTGTDYAVGSTYSSWTNDDWAKVQAARVVLTLVTPDKVGTDSTGASAALSQDFAFTVAIRRRLP